MIQPAKSQNKKRHALHFITFSTILFFVIVVVGSAAFLLSMRQVIRTSKSDELTRILEIERINLEASVNRKITLVQKMAESPLIERYFGNPLDSELKVMAFEELAAYRNTIVGSVFWINDTDKMFYGLLQKICNTASEVDTM